MPFDWNNFLVLARELAARDDVSSHRSAISRAYYFVFNTAFARAERTAGPMPRGERFHEWCWNKYRATPDHSCQQLGINGDRMHKARVKADYKPADIARLDDVVKGIVADADKFGQDLAALNARYPLP
jgi:hypothetical protein